MASPQRHPGAVALAGVSGDGRRWCATEAQLSKDLLERYEQLIKREEITRDPNQEATLNMLYALSNRIKHYTPRPVRSRVLAQQAQEEKALKDHQAKTAQRKSPKAKSSGGFFSGVFGGAAAKPSPTPRPVPVSSSKPTPGLERGIYLWGGCGTGKTFLMNMFHDTIPVEKKKRIHFHEWMIDVHVRLTRLQRANAAVTAKANSEWTGAGAAAQREQLKKMEGEANKSPNADNLVEQVATEMMGEAWLICFDEFQVTHISDAIIMKRLFSFMFEKGAIIVATSNRPPADLYLNGLNRPLFLPFIPMLEEFCDIHDIASSTDYRLITDGEEGDGRVYIHPNDDREQKLLESKFYRICQGKVNTGAQLETQGRRIVVPKLAVGSRVGWFQFKDLCDKPLGAGDYLAIAAAFHTVFVAGIPKLTLQERDQVRRFITMIDAFYEKHVKLVCTAAEDPFKLFHWEAADEASGTIDEIFAWDRTCSRLIEMQSFQYLTEVARDLESEEFLNQYELSSLTDEDVNDMWMRYDVDGSGELDTDELRELLEDLTEKQIGFRRKISDEVLAEVVTSVDTDGNSTISREEFTLAMRNFTTISSTIF